MADARSARARRRGRNRVIVGTAIGVAVCLAGGGAAWAALRPQAPSYRLASAERADVTQTASLAGTVASATRSDRAFQVSGTVVGVNVKVGDKVTAGQTLATLDTSVLNDALTQAQQAVTTAQQKLDDDLDSQTASAGDVTTTASADSSSTDAASGGLALATFVAAAATPATGATPSSQVQAALAQVKQDQSALIDLFTETGGIDALTTQLQTDLAALQTPLTTLGTSGSACDVFAKLQSGTDLTTAQNDLAACQTDVAAALSATASGATAPGATASGAAPASSSGSNATASALTDLGDSLTALSKLNAQEPALVTALNNDEQALEKAVAAAQSSGSSSSKSGTGSKPSSPAAGSGGTGSGSTGSGGTGKQGATGGSGKSGGSGGGFGGGSAAGGNGTSSNGTRGGSTGSDGSSSFGGSSRSGSGTGTGTGSQPASAEQVVADQASLASAQANVAVAQQNVTLAKLTTPISGTVAAVGISAGSSVTASSTSQVISVIGDDGWVVDTAVSASSIGPLKVGQAASVNVSGVSGVQHGTITSIGFLNTSTDSSTPSYDVTVALDGSGSGLLNGASARLSVNVDKASGVLTVPSSAVHLGAGNTDTVDVLSDGKERALQVKVGAVGADRTQIMSGLSAGEQVVLADLSSTVSSDSTQNSTRGGAGGIGGLTGGGAGGAGRFAGGGAGGFGGGAGGFGGGQGGFGTGG